MNANTENQKLDISDRTFHLALAAGAALTVIANFRFGVQEAGWAAYAPFLAALIARSSARAHAWALLYITVGSYLAVSKIITPPIGYAIMSAYAAPQSLVMLAKVSAAAYIFRRLGAGWGIYFFPALAVSLEWLASFANLGYWSAAGLTQVDNLPLVQMTTLAGLAGLSYLVAMGSSVTAAVATEGFNKVKIHVAVFAAIFLAAQAYGQARLALDAPGKTLRVGLFAAPLPVTKFREILNDTRVARQWDDEYFARAAKAADLGARVVVWNEAATLMSREEEPAFVERGKALAVDKGVDMVMGIGVLLSKAPVTWENKYYWIRKDGSIADVYYKLHPTPFEGSVHASAHPAMVEVDGLKLTGAICYDYDFPEIALNNASTGAGLAVIPSSDWKGIDPVHSMMARLQGVSVGISTVRSVRAATSYAADQYGRITGAMRFEDPAGVMVAQVPVEQVPTIFAATGEVLPWLTSGFCLALLGAAARRKKDAAPAAVSTAPLAQAA